MIFPSTTTRVSALLQEGERVKQNSEELMLDFSFMHPLNALSPVLKLFEL